jgi:predicted transcriptional regulator
MANTYIIQIFYVEYIIDYSHIREEDYNNTYIHFTLWSNIPTYLNILHVVIYYDLW